MGVSLLVTGANGFIGQSLVAALADNSEYRILATDMHKSPSNDIRGDNVGYMQADLCSDAGQKALGEAGPFDCIIHLAAILAKDENEETRRALMDANVRATFLLLETARAHNARVLFPSTALVYGTNPAPFTETMPPTPQGFYALSKYLCEQLLNHYYTAFKVSYMAVRLGVLYGPRQNGPMFIPSMITALLKGEDFPMTGGKQLRDFVYVDDLVALLKKGIVRDISGVFNAGSGKAVSMCDVATEIGQLTDAMHKVRVGAIPYRTHEMWDYQLDNTLARTTFDWEPKTSLENGLKATIEYHRKMITRSNRV